MKAGDTRYGDFNGFNPHRLIREPHVAGITREMALQQFGSWISSLFRYEPPRFRFSRSEQRLLLSAMAGGTDEELAGQLSISLSTVKKTWLSVYDRVAACLPELVPRKASAGPDLSTRGRDKKQHLIVYLREHPEELRPTSRKLLRQSAAPARSSARAR
jgi:DNA-binding CsgD family transcriptional regulator